MDSEWAGTSLLCELHVSTMVTKCEIDPLRCRDSSGKAADSWEYI